ncbi:MAG: Abi family protein [Candidatus Excrementavichristensenella sp.]|jgi:abortive infection bacteriophage resistance protein
MLRPLKEAKTYQEQIEKLVDFHCLEVPDRSRAEDILSTVNYYRLSGYGIGLKQPNDPDKYLPGISLEHIYHLYEFDSGLRNILMPLIEYVEISFRTKLTYQLAIAYGAEGYRDATHFSNKTDRNGNTIHKRTIDLLDKEIINQSNLPCVKHHMTVYGGRFPIWVATELFSFGMTCSLYSICSNQDKKKVASEFCTAPQRLYGWMLALLELRNMCAHYNRIYNMTFKQTPYLDPRYQQYNGNRLFPKLFVLKATVKNDMWDQFVNKLQTLFHKYPEAKPGFMGFPPDWLMLLRAT